MSLPLEILQNIFMYLPFEKVVSLDHYIAGKLYNSDIHNWAWVLEGKYLDVVKWFCENKHVPKYIINWAVQYSSLEIVKFLHENIKDSCCTEFAMDYASGNGDLDIVKFLHFNRTEGCSKDAMNWAAINGHFNVVEWLHINRNEGSIEDAINLATQNGIVKNEFFTR